jgi:hypothetical protein
VHFFQTSKAIQEVQPIDRMISFLSMVMLEGLNTEEELREFRKNGRKDSTTVRRMRILQAMILAKMDGGTVIRPFMRERKNQQGALPSKINIPSGGGPDKDLWIIGKESERTINNCPTTKIIFIRATFGPMYGSETHRTLRT